MLGNREHRGEWGVVPDGAKRTCGSRRIEPLPTPHALWYLALCALIVTGCSSDGRTPLVLYSPHGRDLLPLLERRFQPLRPGVDGRWPDLGAGEPGGGRVVGGPRTDLRGRGGRLAAGAVPPLLGSGDRAPRPRAG